MSPLECELRSNISVFNSIWCGIGFRLETTLSTRRYVPLIKKAQIAGYKISLLYFWLSSPKIAIERVAKRVSKGGHNIPIEVIERRYYRGLNNLYQMYMPICNEWTLIDNMDLVPEVIAKNDSFGKAIFNDELWDIIIQQSHEKR